MNTGAMNSNTEPFEPAKKENWPALPTTVYVVSKNSDQIEGRGTQIPIATFTTESVAHTLVNRLARTYIGAQYRPMLVFQTFEEFDAGEQTKLVQVALAKLTNDEKRAMFEAGLLKNW